MIKPKDGIMQMLKDVTPQCYYRFEFDGNPHSCAACRANAGKMFSGSDKPKLPLHQYCECQLVKIIGRQPVTFKGYEDKRFQLHDALIAAIVADFNAHKAEYAGCTEEQAKGIPDLTPELFKSFLIQETGGDPGAWAVDPGQVNNPGDWNPYKAALGLKEPSKRNTGNLRSNMIAALKYLVRKGFVPSAKPAYDRKKGYFEGWRVALERYNKRPVKAANGKNYWEEYADRIIRRAKHPNEYVPMEIATI